MMKSLAFKQSIKLALLFGVLLPLTAAPVLASAETNTPVSGNPVQQGSQTSQTSDKGPDQNETRTATVHVTGGTLSFKSVPDFEFTGVTVGKEATGLKDMGTTPKNIVVENNEGTHEGWTLKVGLGTFAENTVKDATAPQASPIAATLHLNPDKVQHTLGDDVTPKALILDSEAAPEELIDAQQNAAEGDVTIPLTDTLDVSKANYSGSYSAKVTYTLSNDPTTHNN